MSTPPLTLVTPTIHHVGRRRRVVALIAVALAVTATLAACVWIVSGLSSGHASAVAKAGGAAKAKAAHGAGATARARSAKASHAHRARTSSRALPPAQTPVLVLNANGVSGQASSLASQLHAVGYPISGVANAHTMGSPTAVEFRPGLGPSARALARHLGSSVRYVVPLDGLRPADVGSAKLVVIIGG